MLSSKAGWRCIVRMTSLPLKESLIGCAIAEAIGRTAMTRGRATRHTFLCRLIICFRRIITFIPANRNFSNRWAPRCTRSPSREVLVNRAAARSATLGLNLWIDMNPNGYGLVSQRIGYCDFLILTIFFLDDARRFASVH